MHPVTNKEELLERFAEYPDLLGELAAIFLEDGPVRLAAICAGVQRRDAGALETAAHALRGSAANFGATQAALQHIMGRLNLELNALAGGKAA